MKDVYVCVCDSSLFMISFLRRKMATFVFVCVWIGKIVFHVEIEIKNTICSFNKCRRCLLYIFVDQNMNAKFHCDANTDTLTHTCVQRENHIADMSSVIPFDNPKTIRAFLHCFSLATATQLLLHTHLFTRITSLQMPHTNIYLYIYICVCCVCLGILFVWRLFIASL